MMISQGQHLGPPTPRYGPQLTCDVVVTEFNQFPNPQTPHLKPREKTTSHAFWQEDTRTFAHTHTRTRAHTHARVRSHVTGTLRVGRIWFCHRGRDRLAVLHVLVLASLRRGKGRRQAGWGWPLLSSSPVQTVAHQVPLRHDRLASPALRGRGRHWACFTCGLASTDVPSFALPHRTAHNTHFEGRERETDKRERERERERERIGLSFLLPWLQVPWNVASSVSQTGVCFLSSDLQSCNTLSYKNSNFFSLFFLCFFYVRTHSQLLVRGCARVYTHTHTHTRTHAHTE